MSEVSYETNVRKLKESQKGQKQSFKT